jgi:nudix-type nucleoside diphosphatase (YffH/AdpP family)
MKKRVEILSKRRVFQQAIFAIDEVRLRHELYSGGMSAELTRLNLDRGDSAAAILHDPERDVVIFTEQFRYPTLDNGHGWLLEAPAGMIAEADPMASLRREIQEEIGFDVEEVRWIGTFYVSPGGTSERIFLYYAAVSPADKTGAGGGIGEEDIRVVEIPFRDAIRMMTEGAIMDAKALIGLQWMLLRYPELRAGRG